MNSKFIEAIKANKKAFVIKALIFGATVLGLVIAMKGSRTKKDAEDEDFEVAEAENGEFIGSFDYSEEV